MLSYLFSKLNKITENRKERLNRKGKKLTWRPGARPTSPAGPAHEASPVFFSIDARAGCCRRGEHAGVAWPPPASPWPILAPWRRLAAATLILPLAHTFLFPLRRRKPPHPRPSRARTCTAVASKPLRPQVFVQEVHRRQLLRSASPIWIGRQPGRRQLHRIAAGRRSSS